MSEQESLRLVAEVVDRYSGPLKEMMTALKKIGAARSPLIDGSWLARSLHWLRFCQTRGAEA
jgi:hypothetical protein